MARHVQNLGRQLGLALSYGCGHRITEFPDGKILLWRHADQTGHVGYIAALMCFGLPGHIGGPVYRSGKLLIRPEFYSTLELTDVV